MAGRTRNLLLIFFTSFLFSFWHLQAQGLIPNEEKDFRLFQELETTAEPQPSVFVGGMPSLFVQNMGDSRFKGSLTASFIDIHETETRYSAQGIDGLRIYHSNFRYGSQGFDAPFGKNFYLTPQISGGHSSYFRWKAKMHLGVNANTGSSWHHFEEGYAELKLNKLILTVGRAPLYLGQSFVAPLLYSDNATNLNLIKLSSLPTQFPGFLEKLGYFRSEVFFSRLNKRRQPSNDSFAGFRFSWKPVSALELGISGHYQVGGKSVPSASFEDYVVEFLGSRKNYGAGIHESSDFTNRAVAADMRVNLMQWKIPASVYTEQHLEDCCGSDFSFLYRKSYSYLYGLIYRFRPFEEKQAIRLEFVRTSNALYFHQRWNSGTSNEGRIGGHPLGKDGRGLYTQWERAVSAWKSDLKLQFYFEDRGRSGRVSLSSDQEDSPVSVVDPSFNYEKSEHRFGTVVGMTKHLSKDLSLSSQFSTVFIENKANQSSRNSTEWGGYLGLKYSF